MNFGNTDIPKYRRFSVYRKFRYIGMTKKVIPIWVSIPVFSVYRTSLCWSISTNMMLKKTSCYRFRTYILKLGHELLNISQTICSGKRQAVWSWGCTFWCSMRVHFGSGSFQFICKWFTGKLWVWLFSICGWYDGIQSLHTERSQLRHSNDEQHYT